MALWLTILAAGLLTYAIRLSFIVLWGRWTPPEWLRRALRYVPVAVFSAIIAPDVLLRDGQPWASPANPRLIAGLLAVLVAWRTKNIILRLLCLAGAYSITAQHLRDPRKSLLRCHCERSLRSSLLSCEGIASAQACPELRRNASQ
jgi:branched-subunit amino acid transport protein